MSRQEGGRETGPTATPAQAVEAAAKWLHDIDCRSAVHSGHAADFECYDWMSEARELLKAAAPHMLADAWDEGWHAHFLERERQRKDPTHPITRTNPYRTTA